MKNIIAVIFLICTLHGASAQTDCSAQAVSPASESSFSVEREVMPSSTDGCIIDGYRLIALPGYEVVLDSQTGDAECRQTSGGGIGVPFVTCGPCTNCHSFEMRQNHKYKCTGICEIDPCHFF